MTTFTIPAHGVVSAHGASLSSTQYRLLTEPAPIRLCGAPTGAGKTYAFLEAARQGNMVFFVVPTQALADDIALAATTAHVMARVWDGRQNLRAVQEGQSPWGTRLEDFRTLQTHGGMIIATLEALARLTMGYPELQHVQLNMVNLLWRCHHLVFDEAHTLNTRAFGLLHLWLTAIAYRHKYQIHSPKLTLLSATHSNLLQDLCAADYLPSVAMVSFDEAVSAGPDCRWIHGDVTVQVHDAPLTAVVEEQAPALLHTYGKLVIVYDGLIQIRRDEAWLRQFLCRDLGIAPEHILMINGQDRQVAQSGGQGDVFATGTHPEAQHRVIIGTSAIEMGVNLQVDAAIIEPGRDAAALLQRIGRVARGRQAGSVHISTPHEQPSHWLQLQAYQGSIPIQRLRETLAPLRLFNIARAKELGRAYWSMLRRRDRHLMSALHTMFVDLMGDEATVPGRWLDGLWRAQQQRFREQRAFMTWLQVIDTMLHDVRGFAPTVTLTFPDRRFTYSRDWVAKYLRPPDDYQADEDAYVYRDTLPHCLRDRAQPLQCRFYYPGGTTGLLRAWSLSDPDLWQAYQAQYLHPRTFPANPDVRPLYEDAARFIAATGLLPRAETTGGELLDSDVV